MKLRSNSYRMGTNYSKLKVIIGILIIVIAIAGLYVWEAFGEKAFMYTEVVVLSEDITKHKTVEANMLTTIKVPVDSVVKGAVTNPKAIVGKESQVFIPKNMQLVKQFFEEDDFLLKDDEFVLSVPSEWIISYPQALRRGDKVYFSPIIVADMGAYEVDAEMYMPVTSDFVPINNMVSATVYYAKDSTNREVKDESAEPRLDGSGNVSNIEIVVTNAQYQELYSKYTSGYRFVLLYK